MVNKYVDVCACVCLRVRGTCACVWLVFIHAYMHACVPAWVHACMRAFMCA